jgi:hypothetical protein
MFVRRTVYAFVCKSPAADGVRQEAGCTSGVNGQWEAHSLVEVQE